jgi:multiple sugar transport system ATP-binding protein
MADIALEQIAKTYPNGVRAVRDLTIHVADGELVVLVGPSGCGKTTTLRLIAGLEEPTRGTIRIGGKVINDLPPCERDVAMVFQRSTLYPHLTVRRNLEFPLKMRRGQDWLRRQWARWFAPRQFTELQERRDEESQRIDRTAQILGLEEVLDRRPAELSGGQQQRVALGRALVRQPGAFLLDEPLSHLDGRLRAELRHELHLLQRRLRATMVYVTHDQAEAMTLADRVVVLNEGAVQQVDEPLVIYERPSNRFVAEFFGWPAMNFIEGRLSQENGSLRLASREWSLPVAAGWSSHAGAQVAVGLRPEDIRVAEAGPQASSLAMEVVLIEPLGHAWLVTFERDGWQATARMVDRPQVRHKQTVEVFFHMEKAYLFDSRTGLSLDQSRLTG